MKKVQELLKNKMVLIAAGVVVLIIVIGIVAFLVLGKGSTNSVANQAANAEPTPIPVLSLQPADIGLTFTPDANMQRGTMTITQTADIASVDYQLTYTALVSGQPVSRGTIGHADVKTPGQTITQQMVFGTCSDVCHYDIGISDVSLVVKVTKTDGKIYQVQLSVPTSQ